VACRRDAHPVRRVPVPALTRRVAPPQREHRSIMGCALHPQRLCYTFNFTAHTTLTLPPATLQPAAAPTPCPS
jgi:hypothetical protein